MSNERMKIKNPPPTIDGGPENPGRRISPPTGPEGRRILATGLRGRPQLLAAVTLDSLDLPGVRIDRGELSRLGIDYRERARVQLSDHALLDLGIDGRLGDLGQTQAPPPLPVSDLDQLEDLEGSEKTEAGDSRGDQEGRHHRRPDGVEVAVVVGVRHEPERERKTGEHQGPAVEVGDRAPLAETDPGHAVMEVLHV